MADDSDLPLLNRFTLYFDFLGTSDAATNWPKDRLYELLDLLRTIAHLKSEQDIDGSPQDDGSFRFKVVPEVTTFSDHIVVSYPMLGDGEPPVSVCWTKFMCQDAIRFLSGVAEMGLRIGVLIKGGFTFGQLYHEGGVVFGEAMVDAHKLEDRHAFYPRVLVSDHIIMKLAGVPKADRGFLLRDADGAWHLNYFAGMIQHSSSGPIDDCQSKRWKRAHLVTINAAITTAQHTGNLGVNQKWMWFKAQFESATAHINVAG